MRFHSSSNGCHGLNSQTDRDWTTPLTPAAMGRCFEDNGHGRCALPGECCQSRPGNGVSQGDCLLARSRRDACLGRCEVQHNAEIPSFASAAVPAPANCCINSPD